MIENKKTKYRYKTKNNGKHRYNNPKMKKKRRILMRENKLE